MPYQVIAVRDRDSIRTVTLNRPEKRNAMNDALVRELHQVILETETDEAVRCVVLTGDGAAFCAGADLAYLQKIAAYSPRQNETDSRALMEMLWAWTSCAKPTIARVNGHAIAGGCGLMLTCDIAVAVEQAKFGFTEVRIGFVPAIVMNLLRRRVGTGRAAELLMRGRLIDSAEAAAIGMIHRAVPADELDSAVAEIASDFVEHASPTSLRLTKQLLMETEPMSLREAMTHSVRFNAISRTTPDFKRGVQAFLDKRKISWKED